MAKDQKSQRGLKFLFYLILAIIVFLMGMYAGIHLVTSMQFWSYETQRDASMFIFWGIVILIIVLFILFFYAKHKWKHRKDADTDDSDDFDD